MKICILQLCLLLSYISCGKVNDLFNGLYTKDIYSGYLKTDIEGNELFYIFTPSQNSNTDPVLLWLNGGPGCSSLFGFLGEIGPVISELFSNKWILNEHSWNMNLNVFYIESPAGVGFSKTSNKTQPWTDNKTAQSLLTAVKNFFKEHSIYANNDFYISGESYAGIYIPNLAMAIINDASSDKIKTLKGVLIGNGLTDFEMDLYGSMVEFAYFHGIINNDIWKAYLRNCPYVPFDVLTYPEPRNVTTKCNDIRKQVLDCFTGLDVYGIYRPCPEVEFVNEKSLSEGEVFKKLLQKIQKKKYTNSLTDEPELDVWPPSCKEDLTISNFLNSNETKTKLGVDTNITWIQCSDFVYQYYDESESFSFYNEFINEHPELRVWFFSGETDVAVAHVGSVRWINKLKLAVKTEYKPWHCQGQVAGFVQQYVNNFTFVSVKGAGHMVPQDKRPEAKVMLDAFIKGELPQ